MSAFSESPRCAFIIRLAGGYSTNCSPVRAPVHCPRLPMHPEMPPNRGKFARDYDAIVIGTGAGGSSLAYRLAQTGARILVVERGDYLQVPPGTPRDTTAVYLGRYTKPGVTVFCVGGLTKFYGAALYRMRES